MNTQELEQLQDELIDQYYEAYEAQDKDTMNWLVLKLQMADIEVLEVLK